MEYLQEAAAYLKSLSIDDVKIGVVLGSGLGDFASSIEVEKTIPYSGIPHFPVSTVEGHAGQLIYGNIGGKKVLAMQGRFHYYEGYSMDQIAFPIRVMHLLGVTNLIVSNAAGCLNLAWNLGDLMLLEDHINLLPSNPLIGPNKRELGPRFPGMNNAYDVPFQQLMLQIAQEQNINLRHGVYVAVTGPNYETRAEYRYLRTIGADAVGMSTVPEVIAARHMNMRCLAVSIMTDICDPDQVKLISHEEVIHVANEAAGKFSRILIPFIERMQL